MAISPLAPSSTAGKAPSKNPEPSAEQRQKTALNISILKASEASFSAKDQPLALLLRTAIDRINEHLAPELGEDALQTAVDYGIDFSPEATAERVVSLSTSLFESFKSQPQHKNEDEATMLDKFMSTIGQGIDRGFEEAREILSGLQVLEGEVASNIDQTYALVQDGLNNFKERLSKQSEE